jgi:Flp pilus assembly protein TadG
MIGTLTRLARSERGAALVELAIVAPVLAVLIAGVSDISIAYGRKLEIEQAAQRAMEKVMQTTGADTPADTIKSEACMQINGSVTTTTNGVTTVTCAPGRISLADITAEYTLTCDGVSTPYTSDCTSGQTEVRYIETTVNDTYTPIFPIHFRTGSDGTYQLTATAGVRVA